MSPSRKRQLYWSLPPALYAFFLWRTGYSMTTLPLKILDWAAPVVVLGLWAALRWRHQEPWPHTSADRPLLLLALVTTVTAILSINIRNSLQGAWELWLGALTLWAMVDTVRHGWAGMLWRVLYLVGSVVCLISAAEFLAWYLGWPLLSSFQQGWPELGFLPNPLPPALHRLGLALGNTTALSAFAALLIPPAITITLSTRRPDVRRGMCLWLAAAGAVEFLALSRGGFLALGISLPLLLLGSMAAPRFRYYRSMLLSKGWRPLLAGAIVVAVVATVSAGFWAATRFGHHAAGEAVRWDLWRSALAMFHDHPLAGVGPASYGTALRLYRNPLLVRDHFLTAHNLYLNTGAESGMLGLLAGAWLLVALAVAWWRRWQAETSGSASWWRILGAGAALAGLAAQSLVDTFVEPAIVLPATFYVALILAPRPSQAQVGCRAGRWPWATALAVLLLGAAGLAWDDWGYAQFARGLTWTRQGNLERALSVVERARSHDPDMGLYACHAGYLYGRQQRLSLALEQYVNCLAQTPAPGWVEQLNQAALLWQDGQQAEALASVREATARTPLEWMPWLNRGVWAETVGESAEAVESYGWVLALDPELAGSPFWQADERKGQWDLIMDAGQQAAARLGKGTASWRWQVLLAARQSQEAATELRAWLEDHPGNAIAMAWLGEAVLDVGQPAESLQWLNRAIAKAPARGRTYLARGRAKLALARYDDAERDLRMSLFLQPTHVVHLELARLAQQRGDEQMALEEYAQALRPVMMTQGYNVALYGRLGWPAPLPQVARIGYLRDGETALEWGALLEQRGEEAMAQRVYAMALVLDPYLHGVRPLLESGGSDG